MPHAVHHQALSSLLDMLYQQYSVDPKLLHRMPWALLMVMIETEDPIHRDWAKERLRELRHLHEGHSFVNDVADDILSRQLKHPGDVVDLFDVLKTRYNMCSMF